MFSNQNQLIVFRSFFRPALTFALPIKKMCFPFFLENLVAYYILQSGTKCRSDFIIAYVLIDCKVWFTRTSTAS